MEAEIEMNENSEILDFADEIESFVNNPNIPLSEPLQIQAEKLLEINHDEEHTETNVCDDFNGKSVEVECEVIETGVAEGDPNSIVDHDTKESLLLRLEEKDLLIAELRIRIGHLEHELVVKNITSAAVVTSESNTSESVSTTYASVIAHPVAPISTLSTSLQVASLQAASQPAYTSYSSEEDDDECLANSLIEAIGKKNLNNSRSNAICSGSSDKVNASVSKAGTSTGVDGTNKLLPPHQMQKPTQNKSNDKDIDNVLQHNLLAHARVVSNNSSSSSTVHTSNVSVVDFDLTVSDGSLIANQNGSSDSVNTSAQLIHDLTNSDTSNIGVHNINNNSAVYQDDNTPEVFDVQSDAGEQPEAADNSAEESDESEESASSSDRDVDESQEEYAVRRSSRVRTSPESRQQRQERRASERKRNKVSYKELSETEEVETQLQRQLRRQQRAIAEQQQHQSAQHQSAKISPGASASGLLTHEVLYNSSGSAVTGSGGSRGHLARQVRIALTILTFCILICYSYFSPHCRLSPHLLHHQLPG